MPITKVEVDEYQCARCSYKWISRINGEDRPIPLRCAKCKRMDWNKGFDSKRIRYVYDIRKKFGYWFTNRFGTGGWRTEESADNFLRSRPMIEDMKLVLKPMSFLYQNRIGEGVPVKFVDGKPIRTFGMPMAFDIEKQAGKQLMEDMLDKL